MHKIKKLYKNKFTQQSLVLAQSHKNGIPSENQTHYDLQVQLADH